MEYSNSLKATLEKAQEEIRELLISLHDGTLDRITLEAELKEVQERLKVMTVHIYSPVPPPPPGPGPGKGRKAKGKPKR